MRQQRKFCLRGVDAVAADWRCQTAVVVVLAVGACVFGDATSVAAQVREPPRPEKVAVLIRYQIRTELNQRIVQHRAFIRYLESLGFVDDRRDEEERAVDAIDPAAVRLQGVIPAAQVFKVLEHPAIQTVLFAPEGFAWTAQGDTVVPVRIGLRTGLSPRQQQLLHRQVLERLQLFGFQEALGYDTRGNTLIKGRLLGRHLLALWRDFREEPTGWFWSATPRNELPRPLADAVPIRWVEVLTGGEAGQRLPVPQVAAAEAKWDPGLRARLADQTAANQPIRVEAIFVRNMEDEARFLQEQLENQFGGEAMTHARLRISSASVEGLVGNVVTLYFERAADVRHFTSWAPELLQVRLPRLSTPTLHRLQRGEGAIPLERLLEQTGILAMHQRGYRGQGLRLIVLVEDLDGVAEQIGKTLPVSTRLIDLTAELNPDLLPLVQTDKTRIGSGLALAQTVAAVAPAAELVLVRVDPSALFQTAEVVRWLQDQEYLSPALRLRARELEAQMKRALGQKEEAIRKRQQILQNPESQETLQQQLEQAKAAVAAAEALLRQTTERYQRFIALRQSLQKQVYGAAVVIHPRVWDAGYPLDGYSPLSRRLDRLLTDLPTRIVRGVSDRPTPMPPVWMQAASAADGTTTWAGLFRDEDGNGLIEFVPTGNTLPAEHWSRELNFLAWQSDDGQRVAELPAGCTLRCTLQWREPLDSQSPGLVRALYPMELCLWRQLDPAGQKQASDEMTEVVRSAGGPYPILVADGTVVYEQILEWTVPEAGRYAVVIGVGERPVPFLAALQRQGEVYLRLLVETQVAPSAGRVVVRSFPTVAAGVGLPGDASQVVTIGADTPWQLRNGGPSIPLLRKPDYLLPEQIALGTSAYRGTAIGTALGGGLAALLRQSGKNQINPFRKTNMPPETFLRITEAFLQGLPPYSPASVTPQ